MAGTNDLGKVLLLHPQIRNFVSSYNTDSRVFVLRPGDLPLPGWLIDNTGHTLEPLCASGTSLTLLNSCSPCAVGHTETRTACCMHHCTPRACPPRMLEEDHVYTVLQILCQRQEASPLLIVYACRERNTPPPLRAASYVLSTRTKTPDETTSAFSAALQHCFRGRVAPRHATTYNADSPPGCCCLQPV